jgi:hypothetical protein
MLFMGFTVVIHVRGSYDYIEDWNRKTVASYIYIYIYTFDQLKHVFWNMQQIPVSLDADHTIQRRTRYPMGGFVLQDCSAD